MPFCKVNYIRLENEDRRAQHCGERDICDITDYIRDKFDFTCEYCTNFCKCDHPTYQRFVVEVECYDERIRANTLIRMLGDRFGEKVGEMDVTEEMDVPLTSDVGKRIGWIKEGL